MQEEFQVPLLPGRVRFQPFKFSILGMGLDRNIYEAMNRDLPVTASTEPPHRDMQPPPSNVILKSPNVIMLLELLQSAKTSNETNAPEEGATSIRTCLEFTQNIQIICLMVSSLLRYCRRVVDRINILIASILTELTAFRRISLFGSPSLKSFLCTPSNMDLKDCV